MATRIGCAIVDANAVADVFGDSPSEAGAGLRRWISSGNGRLISGGKLHVELRRASADFQQWASVARGAGQLTIFDDDELQPQVDYFDAHRSRRSNDPHVLALAIVSGARLLYSNDHALQQDFTDRNLIDGPRGRVFSTRVNSRFDRPKQRLLRNAPPCREP